MKKISLDVAGRWLGETPSSLRNMIGRGGLPAIKHGNQWFMDESHVMSLRPAEYRIDYHRMHSGSVVERGSRTVVGPKRAELNARRLKLAYFEVNVYKIDVSGSASLVDPETIERVKFP